MLNLGLKLDTVNVKPQVYGIFPSSHRLEASNLHVSWRIPHLSWSCLSGFFHVFPMEGLPGEHLQVRPRVSSLKVSGRYLILLKLRARWAGSVRRPTHHKMGFRQGPQVSQRKKPKTWHGKDPKRRAQIKSSLKVAANKVQNNQNKTYKHI